MPSRANDSQMYYLHKNKHKGVLAIKHQALFQELFKGF